MTLKKDTLASSLRWAVLAVATASANAGVIPGTGAAPSATQLGATDAVSFRLASSGPGHLLLVPYFTAQNGQMSVLHLVNTDLANGKAVKLRWRDAGNGDHLLSLHLLLAPGDVWTATVTQGADGTAQLSTADLSCTYPRLAPDGAGQPFATHRLNPKHSAEAKKQHTREGAIEAIVMADIPAAAVYGTGANTTSALFGAIRPVGGTAPCTTQVLDDALLTDTHNEGVAAARGLATPTGGVLGHWYIIDVPGSTTFSGATTAIQAVNATGQPARGNYVLFPQSGDDVATPEAYTADPVLVSAGFAHRSKQVNGSTSSPTAAAVVRAKYDDLPDLSTPYYLPAQAVNARATAGDLNRLLATDAVDNQYALDTSVSAKTDWVLSMPTRRYSVGIDYNQPPAEARVYSVVPPADGSDNQYFHGGNTYVEPSSRPVYVEGTLAGQAQPYQLCRSGFSALMFFNREASGDSNVAYFTGPPQFLRLCGAASVAAFKDTGASALGASVARETMVNGPFDKGWSSFVLKTGDSPRGLPVIGAAYVKLTNPGARSGLAGNYGITWPHTTTR